MKRVKITRFLRRTGGVSLVALLATALAALPPQVSASASPTALLYKAMVQLELNEQVAAQAGKLVQSLSKEITAEVLEAVEEYQADEVAAIRASLEGQFGAEARTMFADFINQYAKATKEGNSAYLAAIESTVVASAATQEGETLAQRVLRQEIAAAGRFLADAQTWIDLKGRGTETPPLTIWLKRHQRPQDTAVTVAKPKPANALRSAEASASHFDEESSDGGSSAKSFGVARAERRRKALEEAQVGMQQVAAERGAAEEELAAKKLAAAQAEADSLHKQAERLAAAEGEALEQRRNSWSGRLKSIISLGISATGGAVLGAVGARAGEEAASAIFRESTPHHHRGGRGASEGR